jgi:hypothetical protein
LYSSFILLEILIFKIYVRYRAMPTKDPQLNRQYVTKSRQKSINTLGIDEYRRRQAQKQREYRAKKKALRNPHIQTVNYAQWM